jgi:hypothetical protein
MRMKPSPLPAIIPRAVAIATSGEVFAAIRCPRQGTAVSEAVPSFG